MDRRLYGLILKNVLEEMGRGDGDIHIYTKARRPGVVAKAAL